MNLKVLLVDDQEDLRDVLSLFLKKQKYLIRTAASGHEAMRQFDDWHPDLIITDIKMPDGDGIELMDYVAKVSNHLPPVIVYSGYPGPDDEQLRRNPNFAGFLQKPISSSVLIDMIKKVEQSLPH